MPYFRYESCGIDTESERKSYTNRVFGGSTLLFTYEVQAVGPGAARITNLNAVHPYKMNTSSFKSIKNWLINEGFNSAAYERKKADGSLLVRKLYG